MLGLGQDSNRRGWAALKSAGTFAALCALRPMKLWLLARVSFCELAMLRVTAFKTALSALVVLSLASPCLAKSKPVTESVKIDANAESVFQALQGYRNSNVYHRKLVSYDGKNAVVDEQLEGVPVLGNVHCTWEEKEVPNKRIDYTMLKSDKFVSGCGSYVIVPSGTDSVVLELSTEVDSGVKIPFAREIGAAAAHKDMKARLQAIKRLSETSRIAQRS